MRKLLLPGFAFSIMAGLALAQGGAQPNPGTAPNQPSAKPAPTSGSTQSRSPAQSDNAGIRTVDPAIAVRMTYYAVRAADMRASELIGTDVYNLQNENIGEVSDLIIDDGKNIKAIVVSVGGFLGIGERNVAMQPGSIVLSEQTDGSARIVVNTNKEDLKNAPAFDFADVDRAGSGAAMNDAVGRKTNKSDPSADSK